MASREERKDVLSVEDWAEIRRLHRGEGLPIKMIARTLGVSRNTVRSALASDGPPRYRRRPAGSAVDGKDINDTEDLSNALKEWGRHTSFDIGYVALHGSPGAVHIGENELSITELGDSIAGAHLGDKVAGSRIWYG